MKIWRYLETHPCLDCGEDNPVMLAFDHRDPEQKVSGIAELMGKPWAEIEAELAKCDVRCHNHHAVKTAAERGYYSAPALRDYVESWPENKTMYRRYARKAA